jgi:hypothetical protein
MASMAKVCAVQHVADLAQLNDTISPLLQIMIEINAVDHRSLSIWHKKYVATEKHDAKLSFTNCPLSLLPNSSRITARKIPPNAHVTNLMPRRPYLPH